MTWAVSIDISLEKADRDAVLAAEEEIEAAGLSWYSAGTCFVHPESRDIQWRFGTRKAAEAASHVIKEVLLWHGIEHTFSLERV